MRGIGEFLLLDEGVVMKPVEQLRAVGSDHLGLRIVDVGVDEAGHDEAAGVIVNDRVPRRAGENVVGPPTASIRPPATRTAPSAISEYADGPATAGSSLKDRMRPRMTRAFALKTGCP